MSKEIDLNDYEVKEIIHEDNVEHNELIRHLHSIIMDRSIPEANKVQVRQQLDEVIRLKTMTMKPPTIVLKRKDGGA